jgi:hypothetical protein
MRAHLIGTLLAAVAVSALAISLGAIPAAGASATWTVTPGGKFVDLAETDGSTFKDVTTGTVFRCTQTIAGGKFKSGSGLTNPIGTIAYAAVECSSGSTEFGLSFTNPSMKIRAVSYDASTGTVSGAILGIHATLTPISGKPACSAILDGTSPAANDGSAHFNYLDGNLSLRAGIDLHAYNVNGCGGLLSNGDAINYLARVIIGTQNRTINTITSP